MGFYFILEKDILFTVHFLPIYEMEIICPLTLSSILIHGTTNNRGTLFLAQAAAKIQLKRL